MAGRVRCKKAGQSGEQEKRRVGAGSQENQIHQPVQWLVAENNQQRGASGNGCPEAAYDPGGVEHEVDSGRRRVGLSEASAGGDREPTAKCERHEPRERGIEDRHCPADPSSTFEQRPASCGQFSHPKQIDNCPAGSKPGSAQGSGGWGRVCQLGTPADQK